jgi:hypothetical protein
MTSLSTRNLRPCGGAEIPLDFAAANQYTLNMPLPGVTRLATNQSLRRY